MVGNDDALRRVFGRVDAIEKKLRKLEVYDAPTTAGSGVDTFLELTDTPSAFTGQAGKFAQVNVGETALAFDDVSWADILSKPSTFAPSAHAASHQHGGADAVATATPTANAIPKADAAGLLNAWVDFPAVAVSDLSDVDLTGLADGEVLAYDQITGNWLPTAVAAGDFVARDGSTPLTADWDIGSGRKLKLSRIDARDGGGTAFYDDGGNLGLFLKDGGNIGVGPNATNPAYPLDVTKNQNASTVVNVNNTDTTGPSARATFRAQSGDLVFTFEGVGTFGAILGTQTNHDLNFITNDTARGIIKTDGKWGIGNVTSPQGQLHAHDGSGGLLFVTKTAFTSTAQTILPNGTGDVTNMMLIAGVVSDNFGNVVALPLTSAVPGATITVTTTAGNSIGITCQADGSVTVVRTAGTRTFWLTALLLWV